MYRLTLLDLFHLPSFSVSQDISQGPCLLSPQAVFWAECFCPPPKKKLCVEFLIFNVAVFEDVLSKEGIKVNLGYQGGAVV